MGLGFWGLGFSFRGSFGVLVWLQGIQAEFTHKM